MEKTFYEIVRGNVRDGDAERGWESTEVHGLKSVVGHQVSGHLRECPEAALWKGAGPMLLVHKLLHYFIGSYFQITISPNIYHILCTTDQVTVVFKYWK